MYYAPIGLGCYFAALVGTFGGEIALGYGKTFLIYTIVSVLFYFIVYSFYAFIAGGNLIARSYNTRSASSLPYEIVLEYIK